MKQLLFFCVLAMITAAPVVQGEVPNTISYQGFITENGDTLTGNHNFRFNIYDAETVGDLLWTENHTGVMLNGGLFHVILGNSTSLAAIAFDQPYWFGIEVDGGQELPCIEMASSAYSLNARTVMDDAVTSAKIADGAILFEDIGANGATADNHIMKWNGSSWGIDIDQTGGVTSHWNVSSDVLSTNSKWGIARGGSGNTYFDNVTTHVNLGSNSTTWGNSATVGGGYRNYADVYSTVAGGESDTASDEHCFIGGGLRNTASGGMSTVCGGQDNTASEFASFIGGGKSNSTVGARSTIGGGVNNSISGEYATISGGTGNDAGYRATIGGGQSNDAGHTSTVGGGMNNNAGDYYCTVGGGRDNTASGEESTVAGGGYSVASGDYSTVGGGEYNTASGYCSVVPGGCDNSAKGNNSFAGGSGARASHEGTFVWADATGEELHSTEPNQFLIRASGGAKVYSNTDQSAGVTIHAGASAWAVNSDRNLKENFAPVDGRHILEKISALPIAEWNYKTQSESIKHIGPVAQDFYALFGLGDDNVTISTIDPAGVALAGIRELIKENRELRKIIEEMKADIAKLQNR